MPRKLDIETLDVAAKHYAANFLQPNVFSKTNPEVATAGREYTLQCLFNATFKDEFTYLLPRVKGNLGPDALAEFEEEASRRFTPRSDKVFAELLADKLAIDADGTHVPGKVGSVIVGSRTVASRARKMKNGQTVIKDARWPIYAGEDEERAADSDTVDPLPLPSSLYLGDQHLQPL
jgi:hypothetical protein